MRYADTCVTKIGIMNRPLGLSVKGLGTRGLGTRGLGAKSVGAKRQKPAPGCGETLRQGPDVKILMLASNTGDTRLYNFIVAITLKPETVPRVSSRRILRAESKASIQAKSQPRSFRYPFRYP